MISDTCVNQFKEHGYIRIPGGAKGCVEKLDSLLKVYEESIDGVLNSSSGFLTDDNKSDPPALRISNKIALVVAIHGRMIFDAISPAINSSSPGFVYSRKFCPAIYESLFGLAFDESLLRSVQSLLGDEVVVGPFAHPSFRLTRSNMDTLNDLLKLYPQVSREDFTFLNYHLGSAAFSMSARFGLPNAMEATRIQALLPLTHMRSENGALVVIPGSHRYPFRKKPLRSEMATQKVIEADPGDVIMMHSKLFHAFTPNSTTDCASICMHLDYRRPEERSAKPYLPSFLIEIGENSITAPSLSAVIKSWSIALQNTLNIERRLLENDCHLIEANRLSDEYQEFCYDPKKWDRYSGSLPNVFSFGSWSKRIYQNATDRFSNRNKNKGSVGI